MSLKNALLVTCAVVASTATVRSQTPPTPSAPVSIADGPVTGLSGVPAPGSARSSFVLTAPEATGSAADTSGKPGKLDLSALYYFASQNDLARVAAETRLLRAKDPTWQQPEDLFASAGSGVDEQPLWDLFAKHDLAGMRAKIDAMKKDRPDWQPSSNLSGKLALAEAHDALVKASDGQQWDAVIQIATGNKMLLTCRDLEALWRTAEALARTGDEKRSVAAYQYVLTTCSSPHDRLATVQKASLILKSPEALDALVQMGHREPDGRSEFEQIRLDGFRRKIAEATDDPSLDPPAQAVIDALTANADTPAGQADAQLLGWYSYARKDYPTALNWFRKSLMVGPDAKAAQGLVIALRDGGKLDEARAAGIQYAGLDPANRSLMVDVFSNSLTDPTAHSPTDEEMAVLIKAVDESKSQDGAQALQVYASSRNDIAGSKAWARKFTQWRADEVEAQKSVQGAATLGWQLFHDHDVAGAETWFRKSAEWEANEPAAIGLVLAAHALHHDKDYAARVREYGSLFPVVAKIAADAGGLSASHHSRKLATLCSHGARGCRTHLAGRARGAGAGTGQWDRSADEIVAAFKSGQYDTAVAELDQRRSKHAEPRGLSVIRGWALYQKGDWNGARQVFSQLDGGAYSDERAEGLRVIDFNLTNPHYR